MKHSIKFVAVVSAIIALALPVATRAKKNDASVYRNINLFCSLYKELNNFYVDTIDNDKNINTAIDAMLYGIDPYTEYIPAKETEEFETIATGEYGGVGSGIRSIGKYTYFDQPYFGSPAYKAGVRHGDRIVKIDTACVDGWELPKVSKTLRGEAKSKFKLTICRPYTDDSIRVLDITRETINVPTMPYHGVIRGNIGYINLSTFNGKSADEVRSALLEFKANPAVKSIVLDLRGNGGGLVESAVQILGMFLPKGTEVLRTRGRSAKSEKIYRTTKSPIDTEIPLAVLVDNSSASASEIVAGALQDLDRAVIIGQRSFGKGLVQTTRQLPYDNLLKVTVAKYYIPSGRLIQEFDYSHRNPDGTPARVPDSLTNVFHTAHGRIVRDGGGITPDRKVELEDYKNITYRLMMDNWIFNYATKFVSEHKEIAPVGEFKITDEIFNDFKKFIDPSKFNYDKACETSVKNLRETASKEGYLNDSTEVVLKQLETMLHHDLNRDLDLNRKHISFFLGREIAECYHTLSGSIAYSLADDNEINEAEKVLNTPGEYASILSKGSGNVAASKASKNKKKK